MMYESNLLDRRVALTAVSGLDLNRIFVVVEDHGQWRKYRDEDSTYQKHIRNLSGRNIAMHQTAYSRGCESNWIDIHEFLEEFWHGLRINKNVAHK